jgi:hypothetical protein
MKYKLQEPITLGEGEPITELTLREKIVAGDMRGLAMRDPMQHDEILKLIGRLAGQPDPVVNRMAFADYVEVSALVAGFMEPGPATGTKQSLQ